MSSTDDMTRIEQLVGPLGPNQRVRVFDALDENRDGVMRLAESIGTNEKIDVPAAVFISSVNRGDYLHEPTGGAKRMSPREAFRAFFDERRDYLLDATSLDGNAAIEAALDYAVSSLGVRAPVVDGRTVKLLAHPEGETAVSLEDELRAALGRPRSASPDREAMTRDWRRVWACLHDPRIAALLRARMDACVIPREPTDTEAGYALAALLVEIDALGVAPREPVAGLVAGELQPVADALPGA